MEQFKGIIALDIDGTITVERHALEEPVKQYLNHLIEKKWRLIFITGRTFAFTKPILSSIKGEYFFAVQNGAALYDMPQEKCLKRHYISTAILQKLAPVFQDHSGGLLVESGRENGDICYYQPSDFTSDELKYLDFRIGISPEKWEPIGSFDELNVTEFAVGKYFAPQENAHAMRAHIHQLAPLKVIVIRDPFRPGFHLAHVNAQEASKGHILEEFMSDYPGLPVIGAGDDYNDEHMLEKSSVKIVMQNAPEGLRQLADIVAPSADEHGIIQGLEEAIDLLRNK